MNKIRVGICGYGNLGKAVEREIIKSSDMELVAIFTKRNPEALVINSNAVKVNTSEAINWQDKIDVMIMCGGSATDLPEQVPEMAKYFNTVDSFDTHAKIPDYRNKLNEVASKNNKVCIYSIGWDPGLFSLMRLYSSSILKNGNPYTFWGKGVSQGHSDAIRRITGVKNAIQYTIPRESIINSVREGNISNINAKDMHIRECYVAIEEGANKNKIEQEIKTMPNYFAGYETIVHFVSNEELLSNHSKLFHGGFVIHSGTTNDDKNHHTMELSLKLDSNPEFTGSVLIAYARANYRLQEQKCYGAKSIFEIPPYCLYQEGIDDLIEHLL